MSNGRISLGFMSCSQSNINGMSFVVFDLDGTLIDSRLDLAESTNEMLGMYGAVPLPVDRVAMMVGEGARKLVERALEAVGLDPAEPEALPRFLEIYGRRLLVHTRPYDGIPGAIARLSTEHTLAVLTNKPGEPTRRLLDAFGLTSHFRRIVGGDSEWARKPDPAGLRALMDAHGAQASDTWFVGDSMIDVETARRAGVRMCVVLYGFGQLRGELVLDGTESIARTPGEIVNIIHQSQS
jgi:phosphoglycolate phosphatase